MSEKFVVKAGEFEGPLDLLLQLIEKHKLLINEVSLASITDEYLEHIKKFETISLSEISDFIVVASTLLLIKSRSLLPNLELTTEETGNIEDLERRLLIYKKIKEHEQPIAEGFGKNILFETNYTPPRLIHFSPDKNTESSILSQLLRELLKTVPKPEKREKASMKIMISLEDMIQKLVSRIQSALSLSFKEFSASHLHVCKDNKEVRIHKVVSFLAMLELVKQGTIAVSQENHFDDIFISAQTEIETENELNT